MRKIIVIIDQFVILNRRAIGKEKEVFFTFNLELNIGFYLQ